MSAHESNTSISAEIHRAELEAANGITPTKKVENSRMSEENSSKMFDENVSTNLIDNSLLGEATNGDTTDRLMTSTPLIHGNKNKTIRVLK